MRAQELPRSPYMDNVRAKYNALLAKEPPKGAPCKNMKTFLLCCALVVLLVIIMIIVAVETNKQLLPQTETCQEIYGNDPDHGPVGCRVCQQGARSNDISGLPFYNLGAARVSHNLGVYNFVSSNGTSTVNPKNLFDNIVAVRGGSSPNDPGNYVQALGLYFVFAVLMCVLTTLCACGVLWCKMCCNCSCCGRRYPTEKKTFLGFEYMKESGTYQYSSLGIWGTRIFMATFAFFLALWLGLGQVNGNLGMTSSMKALTHSPDGLVSVMRGVVPPIAQLLEDLISKTFVGLFRALNDTVTTQVNLAVILDGVECILNLLGGFPTSAGLRLFVQDLQGALHNLTSLLSTRVPPAIANLTSDLDGVRDQVVSLRDLINSEFGTRLVFLIGNLTLLQDRIEVFNNFTSTMLNPGCCATKANADLDELQGSRNNITSGEYDHMTDTLLSILNNSATTLMDYSVFYGEMSEAQGVMSNLPNYNISADELERHNVIVQQAITDKVADRLADGINQTNEFLASTHGFTAYLNSSVQLLIGNISGVSLDPIRDIILDFNRSTYDIPDFTIFTLFLNATKGIKTTLFPCMLAVADQLKEFDRNVAELPQQFLQIDSIIRTVNDTLQPALDTVNVVESRQQEFEDQRASFNISKQLNDLADTERRLQNYTNQVRESNYLQTVQNAEDKSNLNISMLPQILSLNDSMPGWIVPAENISDVRSIETFRAELNVDLPKLNVDLPLAMGYCDNNFAQACNSLASAQALCGPAAICKVPRHRCAGSETVCSSDSQCTPNRCLTDSARISRTVYNLRAMQAAVYAPSSMNDTARMLADARLSSRIDTTGLEIGVSEANATLRSVETGSLTQDLTDVITSLNEFNASDFTKQLDSINATLNAIDFSSILSSLDDLDGNFQAIDSEKKNLEVANTFLNATRDLFFTRLPGVIDSFSVATLSRIRREEGVAATLKYLAITIDRETSWLDATAVSVLNISGNSTFSTNFSASLEQYQSLVYTICDASYDTYGSAYYLWEVASSLAFANSATIFKPDSTELRVDKDVNGRAYPNGALCITSKCLDNSIDWANSAPLSEVSGGMLPVGLSREQVIGIPYLIPLAILICATISTLLFCRTSQAGWWSSCLATCTCYGAFCCMPIIFIIVGMAFPLVIVSGDICYSAENVGYNVLSQQGDQMCRSITGTGTAVNCVIPWTFRNVTRNTTVDILGTFASLVAPGCNPNSGAIYNAFEQAKDAFGDMPSILIANFINNNTNATNLPINFRWPVKQIFVDAAADLSIHTRTFATGLQQALSCSQLYKIYASFKGAVCCDVVSAFYWALGSWYLIAWTLLCCGCCAGLLGRKRFAYELWGAQVVALRDKKRLEEDMPLPNDKRYSESMHKEQKHDDHHSELVSTPQQSEFVQPPQQQPEPEYVPPPVYQAPPEYVAESKTDIEIEMVSAPTTTKTVEDF